MPWWVYLIIGIIVLGIVGAIAAAIKEAVGRIILYVVCWIIAFPIMLIVWIVKKSRRRSDVGKIMKTTDGYFSENSANTKDRSVAVVAQRKDDGALAVVKLHEDKPGRNTKNDIKGVRLSPKKHPSLNKPSVVEKRVYIGTKNRKPIYRGDMADTGDKLTKKEKSAVKRGAGGSTKKNRRTKRRTLKRWRKHFKDQ